LNARLALELRLIRPLGVRWQVVQYREVCPEALRGEDRGSERFEARASVAANSKSSGLTIFTSAVRAEDFKKMFAFLSPIMFQWDSTESAPSLSPIRRVSLAPSIAATLYEAAVFAVAEFRRVGLSRPTSDLERDAGWR